MAKNGKLTTFEEEFIDQYFLCYFNAAKAYQKTAEKIKGKQVKYTSAKSNGYKLKNKLKDEIAERKNTLNNENNDNIVKLIHHLENQAYFNIFDIATLTYDGHLIFKPSDEWSESAKMAVDNIKEGKNGIEIDFGRSEAKRMLAQYRGLFDKENRVEITAEETGFENVTDETFIQILKDYDIMEGYGDDA